MLRFQLLLFPFLLVQVLSIAQSKSLSFQHIDADKGLTAGYNWYMRHDSRGYLWISSDDGIFRFDGIGMKHYAPNNANGRGMQGTTSQSDFFEDTEGNIWFATNEAINRYVRQVDTFEVHRCWDEDNCKPVNGSYYLFYLEHDTLLWLSAADNIYTYNVKTYQTRKIISTHGVSFSIDTTKNGRLRQIFASSMIKMTPLELITIDSTSKARKKNLFPNGVNNNPTEFQYVLKQKQNLIWLFSNQGLLSLNPQELSQVKIYKFPQYNNQRLRKGVFIDSFNILITTDQSGIWKFNTQTESFTEQIRHEESDKSSMSSNNPWGIYKASYQQLWVSPDVSAGVDGALLRPNPFTNPFHGNYPTLPNVNSIAQDAQGRIWCSTRTDGIFVFNEAEQLLQHFPYNIEHGFSNIRRLSKDEHGQIWALARKGIFIFDTASNNWKKIVAINHTNLSFLVHLSSNRKLISSTNGMIELTYNQGNYAVEKSLKFGQNNTFQFIQLFNGQKDWVYAPLPNELILINRKAENFILEDTLHINTQVYAVWEEKNTDITWLGTTNGLLQLDRTQRRVQSHDLNKGELQVGQIWGVVGDRLGQLWVAASSGLWRYDPKRKSALFFSAPLFSLFSNLRASDGKIWLGTTEGLLVFDPATIRPFPQKIRVGIQSLKVNTIPYEKLRRINIDELTNVKLPYYQNNLILGLVAITQYLPESSIIKYRLRGRDKEWTWIKNGETIHFFNLPARKYQLEMIAYNANNVPGSLRTLPIEIAPPFWQKWWFKALVIINIALVIWGGIQLYVRRRLRQQQVIFERQQALQEERNRIAAELHDDMGAGLSTIRFLSSDLLQEYNNNIKIQQNIQSIYESSGALFENMRDIIWATNVENDTLESLLFYIQSYAYHFLNTNQIHCEFELPDTIPISEVSGSWRRNILLAVKETLHNVVKHAQATRVIIQITIEDQLLHICIQDNGIGLEENSITKL